MKKIRHRFRQIREMYRPFRLIFLIMFTIIATIQAVNMTVPYLLGTIVDKVVKKENGAWVYAMLILCAFLTKNILDRIHGYFHLCRTAYDTEIHIERITLKRVLGLSIGQIMNHNSGFRHEVLKKGSDAIRSLTETLIFQVIPSLSRVVIAVSALFFLHIYLGLIALTCITAFITTSLIINKKMLPGLRQINKAENKLGTFYWEVMKHLRLVIISHQEERTVREYVGEATNIAQQGKRLWTSYFNRVTFTREPYASFGLFAILMTGIYLVQSGNASAGLIVTAMAWSMNAFDAVGTIGSMQRRIARESVHVGRYFDLLEIPPAIVEIPNPIRPAKIRGQIEFRNVSFTYPSFKSDITNDEDDAETTERQSSAIQNVSFVIQPGTTCAFVGASGAGKSTVINLLLRGYDPDHGQILVDGHDLRLVDLGLWRKSIGCVEQDPKLWDNTLGYNMLYCLNGEAQQVPPSELEDLAHRTRIDEFYDRLGAKRFDTEIGEGGVQLSGGQRQRVAIARAIAKEPSVLIFDEATNALDPENERLIHESIHAALEGRTGIIIAHRLSTVRHADQIIMWDHGTICGRGTHEELMDSCPAYRSLVELERDTLKC